MQLAPTYSNLISQSIKMIYHDWLSNSNDLMHLSNNISHFRNSILNLPYKKGEKVIKNELEIITFSLLPSVTNLWMQFAYALDLKKKIIIGDCSGHFCIPKDYQNTICYPIMNLAHGYKIDYFIKYICNAKYVIVSDDDILFMDSSSINWAIDRLNGNSNLAVVSLSPRAHLTQWVPNVEAIMGSYFLVIRRDIWLKNKLSFQVVKPHGWKKIGNHYDTGDFAHRKLIELGYNVLIAPQKIRKNIISFTSVSVWGSRITNTSGYINNAIRLDRPDEHKKAYRTALILSKLNCYNEKKNKKSFSIKDEFINRTISICKKHLNNRTIQGIKLELSKKFEKIDAILKSIETT